MPDILYQYYKSNHKCQLNQVAIDCMKDTYDLPILDRFILSN